MSCYNISMYLLLYQLVIATVRLHNIQTHYNKYLVSMFVDGWESCHSRLGSGRYLCFKLGSASCMGLHLDVLLLVCLFLDPY